MFKHVTIAVISAGVTTAAIAQTAPLRPRGAGASIGGQDRNQLVSTQMLMQSSGGSLLQASLPQQPETSSKTPVYSLYAVREPEPKVLKKHDLVNIIVREESQTASKGTTDLKKTADIDAKVDQWIKFNIGSLSLHGTASPANPVEAKMEGARDFKGDATVNRTDSVVLRLEAEVIDVKPNGTLVLQARKHILSDDEDQTMIMTGVCRVQDVDASNSVLSTDLHDLDLQKTTKGAVRDTTKRGLLPRLLDFVNPF